MHIFSLSFSLTLIRYICISFFSFFFILSYVSLTFQISLIRAITHSLPFAFLIEKFAFRSYALYNIYSGISGSDILLTTNVWFYYILPYTCRDMEEIHSIVHISLILRVIFSYINLKIDYL